MKTNFIKIVFLCLIVLTTQNLTGQCFTKISAINNHIVAMKPNGTIWVWGRGTGGQLGGGDLNFQPDYETPTQIGTDIFASVSAGFYNTFAIKLNGTLWATGLNLYGALGLNSTISTATLTQIGTANNWKQVASEYFTLALKTDGTMWASGQNGDNQMGDGNCCSNRLVFGQVGTATDWKKVGVSGVSSGFALKNNGTLWVWGSNICYMLAQGNAGFGVPTQHNTATDWSDISIGKGHVLALKTNGTLWAWGCGANGETADGLPISFVRNLPRQIGTSTWKAFVAGDQSSYGIKTDGTLWAWGRNDLGQLGLGNTTNQPAPVQIGTSNDWNSVTAGSRFGAALKNDGSLWTWGNNIYGVLGNGTFNDGVFPAQVAVTGCALPTQSFELEKAVTISPNPVQSDLEIRINKISPFVEMTNFDSIVIVDLTGKQVYQTEVIPHSQLMVLNVASLAAGIYNVVFKNGNAKVLSKKLIKN